MRAAATPVYAPNISWLLPGLPFAERPRALAAAGFGALEFGFPSHADLDALQAAREAWGLEIVLFNQDVPVWDAAHRGTLSDPARGAEFERTLDQALEIARRLGVHKIMLPAGVALPDRSPQEQTACALENLRAAAARAADAGVMLTLEVLNPIDNPGYVLTSAAQAVEWVRALDHPQVRFQFDSYHLQVQEGDLATVLEQYGWAIGHVQFADHPGRHEPGSGGIDFPGVLAGLERAGYSGSIGLEYIPRTPGIEALDWVPQSARRAPAGGQPARRGPTKERV